MSGFGQGVDTSAPFRRPNGQASGLFQYRP